MSARFVGPGRPARVTGAAVAVLALAVGGCATDGVSSTAPIGEIVDAKQHRAELDALFEDTGRALGTRFQVTNHSPAPLSCDRPHGKGHSFLVDLRVAPQPKDVPAAVTTVERFWRERGLSVTRREHAGLHRVVGRGPHGTVTFGAGTLPESTGISLTGETACAPGSHPPSGPPSR